MLVGGCTGSTKFLMQDEPNLSGSEHQQVLRWNKFVDRWKSAARNKDVLVIGDVNLDFRRWQDPDSGHIRMVEKVKRDIETLGFHQQVEGVTRNLAWNP